MELDFGAELGSFGDANDEQVILSKNDAGIIMRMGTGIRPTEGCSTGPAQRQGRTNPMISPFQQNQRSQWQKPALRRVRYPEN